MSDKYPYISGVEIVRRDGRRDNLLKSVKLTVFTSYKKDEPHKITFSPDSRHTELTVKHRKDYGLSVPTNVTKVSKDVTTGLELAWEELESLGLDDLNEWDDDGW